MGSSSWDPGARQMSSGSTVIASFAVYRDGKDAAREAEIMAYVGSLGYPVPTVPTVPTVHDVAGPDLVIELLDGPTMAAALEAAALELSAAARMLADLQDRLHALPARSSLGPAIG